MEDYPKGSEGSKYMRKIPTRVFVKTYVVGISVPLICYYIGRYIEYIETSRMTSYRDKSALYGPDHDPNDPPSWPNLNYPFFF